MRKLAEFLKGTVMFLMVLMSFPIMILNILGGFGAAIWLGILGEWAVIGYGVLGILFSHYLIGLLFLPLMLPVGAVHFILKKMSIIRMIISLPFCFLISFYLLGLISAWCLAVLFFFIRYASEDSYIPILIWSYCVALAPLQYMVEKGGTEGRTEATIGTIFPAQVAYITLISLVLFADFSVKEAGIIFLFIMEFALVIHFIVGTIKIFKDNAIDATQEQF